MTEALLGEHDVRVHPIENNPNRPRQRYWAISSGSSGRDYSRDFLTYGIAFVGKEFASPLENIAPGDRVILKSGSAALAAGVVAVRDGRHRGADDKDWLSDFDGWDLPVWAYVDWRLPLGEANVAIEGLRPQGATFEIIDSRAQTWAEDCIRMGKLQETSPEPPPTREISDDEMLRFLVEKGLRVQAADVVQIELRHIRLLVEYYERTCWDYVGEHEARCFLVSPLLLALGWAEQQLKIELAEPGGGRIDIACFATPYRRVNSGDFNRDECILIIETKAFGEGLDLVNEQGERYASQFPSCRSIVVTNGFVYKCFDRVIATEHFTKVPSAHMNLTWPRDRHPRDPSIEGALGVLHRLMPRTWS